MSQNEPTVGSMFLAVDENGVETELEIEEVCEVNDDGTFNVAADGDFYDIMWDEKQKRWTECE